MKELWTLPASWPLEIYQAIEDFIAETRITKKRLAEALSINMSSLSLSHLQAAAKARYIYQRLPHSLRRDNLFVVASRLQLDLSGIRSLKKMASRILASNTGYVLDPDQMVETSVEAAEVGMMGVDLFDADDWQRAIPLLHHAWAFYDRPSPQPAEASLYVSLRVATQLIEWHSAMGQARDARDMLRTTLGWARGYSGGERKLWRAVGLAYNAAGTALRHAGAHPRFTVEKFQIADRICKERGLLQADRIANLRNHARPLVWWGVTEDQPDCYAAAFAALRKSEALAGGQRPIDEAREEWTFTRLTHIECLAVTGERQQAVRLWEETNGLDEVAETMKTLGAESFLRAKWAFAEMAVCFARNDFDTLASLADAFCRSPRNARHGDRLNRSQAVLRLAVQGDRASLQRLLAR